MSGNEQNGDEMVKKLLNVEQLNLKLQEKLQRVEAILEATQVDAACKSDMEQLQGSLEELRSDIADREAAIARMKAMLASEEREEDQHIQHVIAIGNPGAGKSTLLNSLIRDKVFESGFSLVDGLTRMCTRHECKGMIFLDTPGLADTNFREQAAKEISAALSIKGKCKIIFVVTLEAARVRSEDWATLQLVIESLLEAGVDCAELNFAVVVNKVQKSKVTLKPLEVVIELREEEKKMTIPIDNQICIMEDPELEIDKKWMLDLSDQFEGFINGLPCVCLGKHNVNIRHDKYEQLIRKYQIEIEDVEQELEKHRMPDIHIRKRLHIEDTPQPQQQQPLPKQQQRSQLSQEEQRSIPEVARKARRVLCIGNAGVGTTLLTNLMEESITQTDRNKFEFLETEGLADSKSRQSVARKITSLLRMDCEYSIFFILVLNGGRLRPEDKETIKLVLDAVPEIGDGYSVIINKMTEQSLRLLKNPQNVQKLESELFFNQAHMNNKRRQLHFIMKHIDGRPQLPLELVQRAPSLHIKSAIVTEINGSTMEQLRERRDKLKEPLTKLEKNYRQWQDYVQDSKIRWLKVSYLRQLKEMKCRLPRCQDLPPNAFQIGSRGSFQEDCVRISRWVVSHPWRSPRHPDPDGVQLRWICDELQRLGARDDDLLFFDYTACLQNDNFNEEFWKLCDERFQQKKQDLPEEKWTPWPEAGAHPAVRNKEEELLFKEIQLKGLEQLFRFRGMKVLIAPIPPYDDQPEEMLGGDCPANPRMYKFRGWCLFEYAVAHVFNVIVNSDNEDLQKFCDLEVSTPEQFRKAFSCVKFTNDTDKQVVIDMFDCIFRDVPEALKILGPARDVLQIKQEELEPASLAEVLVPDSPPHIWSTDFTFLARLRSGKVIAWGDSAFGADISAVREDLEGGIEQIWSSDYAFLARLRSGKVIAWGDSAFGADISDVREDLEGGIEQIWSSEGAFLASLRSGKVIAWGGSAFGADISAVREDLEGGIEQIWSSGGDFLARLRSGRVIAWGSSACGANISAVREDLEGGIEQIWSSGGAFFARLRSGKVIAWGDSASGADISDVREDLEGGIEQIWSSSSAFLVRLRSGKVIAWGDSACGADISAVREDLEGGIEQIWSSGNAFLARLRSGRVIAWGSSAFGADISAVREDLEGGIEQIWSSGGAFLARLRSGRVIAWGDSACGADISAVREDLEGGLFLGTHPIGYRLWSA